MTTYVNDAPYKLNVRKNNKLVTVACSYKIKDMTELACNDYDNFECRVYLGRKLLFVYHPGSKAV